MTAAWADSMSLPPLTGHEAFTVWQLRVGITVPLLLTAVAYLAGGLRVRRSHPGGPWPARRTAAFLAGLGTIAVATQSSVGAYDDVLFSVHMVQHLLLIMVAPPLLVFGRPVTLLLHASRNPVHTTVKRLVRSRLVTSLTWPAGVAVLYAGIVAGTHLTPFMNLVVENETVHNVEHVMYLVGGYLYFLPIVGSEPIRSRPTPAGRFLLLTLTMPVDIAVGVALMQAPHELFPAYLHLGRTWGPTPLADLHAGGEIMLVGSTLIMTLVALVLAVLFVADRRQSGRLGGWAEGVRAASLRRGFTAAGLAVPERLSARTIDSGDHLDAYNDYLAQLTRQQGGRPAAEPPME